MTPAEFDLLYAQRHNQAELQSCVSFIQSFHASEYDWQWRAARLAHFQAMQAQEAGDTAEALEHFKRGSHEAAKAEAQYFERVEGVFWRAVCEMEAARLEGKLAAARMLGGSQKRIERAAAMDEGYHFAGPMRVLGRITHLKPLLLGGNLDRAIAFYRRALQLAPGNSTTILYLADALIADRQIALARQTLNQLVAAPLLNDWIWEGQRDQRIAQEWLQSRFDHRS